MVLPLRDDYYIPIFNFFKDGKTHSISEVLDYVIDFFKLDEKDINEKYFYYMSQPIFVIVTRRVLFELFAANLLEIKTSKKFIISKEGQNLFNENINGIDLKLLKKCMHENVSKIKNGENINFNIRNIGTISELDMDISKITVIGGQNSTGKSTVSKILYCYLKSNSSNRHEYAYESVITKINQLLYRLRRLGGRNETISKVVSDSYVKFINEYNLYNQLEIYENLKDFVYSDDFPKESISPTRLNGIYGEFDEIEESIDIIEDGGTDLLESILKSLIVSEFRNDFEGEVLFKGYTKGKKFLFSLDFSDGEDYDNYGEFFINDVFYIDSFSCLDLNQNEGLTNTIHVKLLLKSIDVRANESYDALDKVKNKILIDIKDDVSELIDGDFNYENGELKYFDETGVGYSMSSTASGIKQLGIIQLLLNNRKLKPNSFLIIDEPEVNLHPEWQIKFAEILVTLVKKLNIYVYVNTHSPMFIEAMSIFSEYYHLKDETNFYLTEKQDNGFTFKKIANDDMGAVYENLSRPYDDLDDIKAEILFRD